MSTKEAYKTELAELLKGVAANVRRLREGKESDKFTGYSQEDLAKDADLHRTEISKIECGTTEPRLTTLLVLADALGVTLNDLVTGLPVPKERRPSPQSRRPRQAEL